MNKAQLIDVLAERLGDKRVAAAAVAGLVDVVVRTVSAGDKVTITGFGVFEKRERAARTARNPRTGDAVTVQQTHVPAFRPGTYFRELVSGMREPARLDAATTTAAVRSEAPTASPPAMGSADSGASMATGATIRPATRMTAGGRLTIVPVVSTEATKTAEATKPAKTTKTTKATKATGNPAKAVKPAKPAKVAKKKAKTAARGPHQKRDKEGGQEVRDKEVEKHVARAHR